MLDKWLWRNYLPFISLVPALLPVVVTKYVVWGYMTLSSFTDWMYIRKYKHIKSSNKIQISGFVLVPVR